MVALKYLLSHVKRLRASFMNAAVNLFRISLLAQFALFLSELFREVRVFTYTYRFHRLYPLYDGSCLAETFTWRNALTIGVLSVALVSVIGLAGFRRWSQIGYLVFLAVFLLLLPFLGPYDSKSALFAAALTALFVITAACPFSHSLREKFTPNVLKHGT